MAVISSALSHLLIRVSQPNALEIFLLFHYFTFLKVQLIPRCCKTLSLPSPIHPPKKSIFVSTLQHIGVGAWRPWRGPATLTARPGVRLSFTVLHFLVRKVRLITVSSSSRHVVRIIGTMSVKLGVSLERPLSTSHRSQ